MGDGHLYGEGLNRSCMVSEDLVVLELTFEELIFEELNGSLIRK